MSDVVDTSEGNSSADYLMTKGSILELLKVFYNNVISNNIYKVSDSSVASLYKEAAESATTIEIDS
jgi:hypothetical protein